MEDGQGILQVADDWQKADPAPVVAGDAQNNTQDHQNPLQNLTFYLPDGSQIAQDADHILYGCAVTTQHNGTDQINNLAAVLHPQYPFRGFSGGTDGIETHGKQGKQIADNNGLAQNNLPHIIFSDYIADKMQKQLISWQESG